MVTNNMNYFNEMIFPGIVYMVAGISLGYVSALTTGNFDLQKSTLRCNDIIPRTIPYDVKAVSIDEYSETFIDDAAFVDVSWKDVEHLDIWGKDLVEFRYLNNSVFYPLQQLKKLRLRLYALSGVSNLTFNGLSRLEVLEFHDCVFLDFVFLAIALKETNVLVNLHTLVLRDDVFTYAQTKYFDQDFVDCLITRNISTLVVSGFNVLIRNIHEGSRPLPVVKLDVSNSILEQRTSFTYNMFDLFSNVKILNNSGVGYLKTQHRPSEPETCLNSLHLSVVTRIRKIYSDNFRRPLRNCIFNLDTTSCENEMSYFSLRFSGISLFDLTVKWPMDSPKIELDLSSNVMSAMRVSGYMPVYKLNLSSNELHHMESRSNFREIFRAFTLLEYIDISKNNLNFLPHDIFSTNMLLKEIRLSGNYLKSITFDISMLNQIAVLDLTNNSIVTLDPADRQKVLTLETASLKKRSIERYFVLDIRRNPLECSCETIAFIEWIISKQTVDIVTTGQSDVYDLTCDLEGNTIEIDNTALNSSKYLCIRTMIYVIVCISLLIVVFVICMVLVKIRRRNMTKSMENLIAEFKLLPDGERFLVMLSHSKDDGAIVFHRIFERFENALKHIVKVEKEVICIGDTHFRPGVAIVDEIYRCIKISYIAVFVISRSFCKSAWCKLELKEAFSQSKPIILIFLEEVPIDDMSPLMKEIFNRFTRVRITRENGHLIIRPSWNVIAKSVLTLSALDIKAKHVCLNIFNLI